MKMIRLNSMMAILIAIVMMTSCKKESKSGGPEGYVAPSLATQQNIVEVPAAIQNSQDPNLSMANSYISMVNAFGSMKSFFANVPANATMSIAKSTAKTYTWTSGGYTIWVEFLEGTLDYSWTMYIQDGETYITKTKFIVATELKTGLGGTMKIYSPDIEGSVIDYAWSKVGTTLNATLLFNMYGEGAILFTMSVSDDGSGTFNIYYGATTAAIQIFHLQWTAAGHGSWWVQDPDGTGDASGTF